MGRFFFCLLVKKRKDEGLSGSISLDTWLCLSGDRAMAFGLSYAKRACLGELRRR